MKQPWPEYGMSDSATKHSRAALRKKKKRTGRCEPGCLHLSQPMRGAPSDLNYRAAADWLTAEETGGRPAESAEGRAGVCGGRVGSTVRAELVGGRDVENTVWNHKSSGSKNHRGRLVACVAGRQALNCGRYSYGREAHTHTESCIPPWESQFSLSHKIKKWFKPVSDVTWEPQCLKAALCWFYYIN